MSVTRRSVLGGSLAAGVAASTQGFAAEGPSRVERWGLWETALHGPAEGNPFVDVTLAAVFECDGSRVRVPGFYDGEGVYRIRFSPPEMGCWRWTSESNAPALAGQSGAFEAVAPGPGNHGPVRVSADGFHFTYADGTPYRQMGTTAYAWALQADAKCAETIETLKTAPFNKMRMVFFPSVPSVAVDPFARTGEGFQDWDATRFDPAYFRRFEDRIRRLGEIGVEADVILYHPYDPDKRGYSTMRRADDERYLRYIAARFGAYRNLWWSMANEYDLVEAKSVDDWDHLGAVLHAADPHDRLRSIHQFDVYYDVRKPWITHASVQNNFAVLDDGRAQLHRAFADKPVIFDEVGYEGNFSQPWGNLTPEELVERFWFGLVGGTYVGHGEVWHPSGNPNYSWLGQGGKLTGTSVPRLAFLRRIMEDGPVPGFEPIQAWWNYRLAGKPFETYLRYFGKETPDEWRVVLPRGSGTRHGRIPPWTESGPANTYRAEIIDTWNMTVTPVDGVFRTAPLNEQQFHAPDRPAIALPRAPYLAVRFSRVRA
ncbi:MAG TPA: DUF5060 domain-containing protein [Sphingomonas sp.]|nr:DUF5060 domain-containing protein [Sphingomonas sp.]